MEQRNQSSNVNSDSVVYEEINDDKIAELLVTHKDNLTTQVVESEVCNNTLAETIDIGDEVVHVLKSGALITEEEVAKLRKAQKFLLATFTQVPQFRPRINKLTSVLSDGTCPSMDAKYWQCKAEAEVHFKELQRETFKFRKALVDLKEINYKISSIKQLLSNDIIPADKKYDPELVKCDLERLQIKKDQYEFELKQLEKTMKYRIEELVDWDDIAGVLEDKCRYSTTDCSEHLPETHYKILVHRVKTSKTKEEKRIFEDQLNTFHKIVGGQKAREYAESDVNDWIKREKSNKKEIKEI